MEKIGYGRRLDVLTNELSHAIHDKEGLFKNY